jgi:hypothetical protein
MNDHIFEARPLKTEDKWTLWKRRLHHYGNILLAGHLRETADADIFPNERTKAQQSRGTSMGVLLHLHIRPTEKFCRSSDVCHKTEVLPTENTTLANSESYPDIRQPSE